MVETDSIGAKAATTNMLVDAGIALMRQNIRRRHPAASEADMDAWLREWLYRVDDPISGDVSGAVRVRERGL